MESATTGIVTRHGWSTATISLLLVGLFAIGLGVGYALGSQGSEIEHLVGRASVGADQASIQVDDVFYGMDGLVPWIDGDGTVHDGDWPTCLIPGQTVTVQFGGQLVDLPGGSGGYRVAYVDCRPIP